MDYPILEGDRKTNDKGKDGERVAMKKQDKKAASTSSSKTSKKQETKKKKEFNGKEIASLTGKEWEAFQAHQQELRRVKEENRKARAAKARQRNEMDFRHQFIARPLQSPVGFPGPHKWLGGAVDTQNGHAIYGIPSHSHHLLCLAPDSESCSSSSSSSSESDYRAHVLELPKSLAKRRFKWLRGLIHNGYLYGIPAWSTAGILRVDIDALWKRREPAAHAKRLMQLQQARAYQRDKRRHYRPAERRETTGTRNEQEQGVLLQDIVTVLPLPSEALRQPQQHPQEQEESTPAAQQDDSPQSRWMWHGATLNQEETAIYCIPSNAAHVLKVCCATGEITLLPLPTNTSTPVHQTNKWYGGIRGWDNAVYGMPYAAAGVLRIDTKTDTVQILGDYGLGRYNWHGGLRSSINGAIYAFPAHSSRVLKIDTAEGKEGVMTLLEIERPPYDVQALDQKYKWLGGSYGADGCIYGMPSDASTVLQINPRTDRAWTFGVTDGHCPSNKWQGGVLARDGFIYAVPADAKNVLRIDSRPCHQEQQDDEEQGRSNMSVEELRRLDQERIGFVGQLDDCDDKWQGGFLSSDGSTIYGIPENCPRILRIAVPEEGENVTADQVALEFL